MLSHYEIYSDDEGYIFTTDLNIKYRIVFDDLSSIFNQYPPLHGRVFSFSFYPVSKFDGKFKSDPKIRLTIAHSLQLFFKKNDNLIVFVCDSTDNREMCRKKLFDKWFENFNDGVLEKYDGIVRGHDYQIMNALIFKSDLRNKDFVIGTFKLLNDEFSRAK